MLFLVAVKIADALLHLHGYRQVDSMDLAHWRLADRAFTIDGCVSWDAFSAHKGSKSVACPHVLDSVASMILSLLNFVLQVLHLLLDRYPHWACLQSRYTLYTRRF